MLISSSSSPPHHHYYIHSHHCTKAVLSVPLSNSFFSFKQWLFVSLCYFWLTCEKHFLLTIVWSEPSKEANHSTYFKGMVRVLEISCLQNRMMDWRIGSQKELLCTTESKKSTLSLMFWIRGQDASTSFPTEKATAPLLQCSRLEKPRVKGAWWAADLWGSHRVGPAEATQQQQLPSYAPLLPPLWMPLTFMKLGSSHQNL